MFTHIPPELNNVLVQTEDTLHGAIRFKHTRVFAETLFDYTLNGHSLAEFLDDFEGVQREDALAVLNWAHKTLSLQFQPGALA